MKRSRFFERVLTGLVVVMALIGVLGTVGVTSAYADDVATAPQYTKSLTANGDGTYTLSLSVTGKSSSSSSTGKADVIVVLDNSASMGKYQYVTSDSDHQNDSYGRVDNKYVKLIYSRGYYYYNDGYGNHWYDTSKNYRVYQVTDSRLDIAKRAVNKLASQLLANNATSPDAVQLSLVTFASISQPATEWTTDLETFESEVNGTSDYSEAQFSNRLGGTNWEHALETANAVQTREGAAVYVIFVSDGDPTFRLSYGTGEGQDGYDGRTIDKYTVYGTGNSDNYNNNYNAALTQAKKIVGITDTNTTPVKNLYSIGVFGNADKMKNLATDSGAGPSNYYKADDETGINAAFASIIAKITNAATYKNVVITDGITTMTSTNADLPNGAVDFTYTRSDGATYDGPEATYSDKTVTWDMGSTPLADGVTYTVSFRVWPSQAAYDLVAALMNGTETYDQLSQAEKAQIVKNNDGTYSLKTNTENRLSYDQVLTKTTNQKPAGKTNDDGSISGTDGYTYTYDATTGIYTGTKTVTGTPANAENPDPMPLTVVSMPISKSWVGGTGTGSVTFKLVTDDAPTNNDPSVTLPSDNGWKSSVYLAPGLKAGTETLDTGHNYTLVETSTDSSYEFSTETAHPMLVDGKLDYDAGSDNVLTGTNTHKGSLKITKKVEGTGYNADTKFTFVIGLGSESSPVSSDDSGNKSLEYRVYNSADNTVASSGKIVSGTATVSITASQYILVVDVPTDTPYSVYETDIPDGFRPTSSSNAIGKIAANTQTASSFTNTYAPGFLDYTTSYTVTKTWDDSDNAQGTRPDSLAVTLEYSVDGGTSWEAYGDKVTLTQAADGTWSYTFTNLPMFNSDGSEIMYRAAEDTPANYTGTTTVTPTHFELSTDLNAIKRVTPCKDIDFTIESGGVGVVIAKLTAGNGFYVWTSKPLTAAEKTVVNTIASYFFSSFDAANTTYGSGNPATYVNGKQGSVTISADATTGVHIDFTAEKVWSQWAYGTIKTTTTSTPGTTSFTNKLNTGDLSITKTVTAADGVTAPKDAEFGFTVTLKDVNGTELKGTYVYTVTDKDGKDVTPETATITSGGTITLKAGWTATINGLVAGTSYDVSETSIPNGFTNTSKTADTGKIANGVTATAAFTNTYELTNINITKSWADDGNRDGIRTKADDYASMVTLYADGHALIDTKPVVTDNGDNTYTVTFSSLPKTTTAVDSGGAVVTKDIVYTVVEKEPAGYTASYSTDGLTITNTHTPATTSAKATKVWSDGDNQDGKRPTSVTLQLQKSVGGAAAVDVEDKTLTLSADNSWAGTIDSLPAYEGGKAVTYSFVETSVPEGYTSSYSEDGLTVTNTHTPETTSVSGTKVWDDNSNQDGKRTDSVTLQLRKTVDGVASDVEGKTLTLDADNKWTGTISDLPAYEGGEAVTYSFVETSVPEGYTSSYSEDGLTVTNTHTPETTSVSGTKVWDDNSNQDGKRTDSVTLQLQKSVGGAAAVDVEGKTLTLDADNKWTGTIADLPAYEGGEAVTYSFVETSVPEGYTPSYSEDGLTVTNTHTPETTSAKATKVWSDNDNQDGIRANVTLHLTKTVNGETSVVEGQDKTIAKDATGDDLTATWTNLPVYESGSKITYGVTEDAIKGYETGIVSTVINGVFTFTVTNTHTPATTSATATKAWDDNANQDGKRPTSVTLQLQKSVGGAAAVDVEGKTLTLDADNKWTGTIADLPAYEGGEAVTYSFVETSVPEGYTSSYSEDGLTVTNTHTPETTSVSGTKVWDDNSNQDGMRPTSVVITLTGTVGESTVVSTAKTVTGTGDTWAYSFTDLPKYSGGQLITYTVSETSVPDDYSASYAGDAATGITVTNSHTPEVVSVSGTKTWADAYNQDGKRPGEITVRLTGSDGSSRETTTDAAKGWKYSFDNLPKYSQGAEITYTLTEDAVVGYTPSYDGYDVTNSYTPGETSVSVTKLWYDGNDQDGKRPDSVTVQLLADGVACGEPVVLSEGNNWTNTWTKLPVNRSKNSDTDATVAVVYTVQETSTLDDYASAVSGNATKGFTVTNTHAPATTSVSATKTWDDADDQDGIRPASITYHLLADGVEIDSQTVTADDGWSYAWDDLPANSTGTHIDYTVTEDKVDGYAISSKDSVTDDGKSFSFTNTHAPEVTEVSGTKTWADGDDQDGIRPDSVTVNLLANGTVIKTAVATAENGWSYSFTDLPKYSGGQMVSYSVEEVPVPGYQATVSGFDLTNTHVPATGDITVTKVWSDSNDKDGIRPASVTVRLYADGVDTGRSVTLSADDSWTATFSGLATYDGGSGVTYSVVEDAVSGYTVAYTSESAGSITVTNTHVPTITPKVPDTGDNSGIGVLAALVAGAAAIAAGAIAKRKDQE